MPCCSAATPSSTSSRGPNCSADALYPNFSSATSSFLLLLPRLAGMAPALTAVTDRVHLAQGDAVNWVLAADDTGVTLIDAGYPGDRDDVLASLRQLGFGIDDVRAIVLTHAHIDHFGSAIWFAKNPGMPVYCH